MDRRLLAIEDIHVGQRHRKPDMAKVREIAKSIRDVGLLNMPAVCVRNDVLLDDGERSDSVPVLIYGRHRLLALQELGKQSVECIVYDVDDLQAELMEIDENLARSELSPAEEAAHIRRRQEIWQKINGKDEEEETGRISPSLGGRGKTEFAAEVAAIVGNGRNPESVKRDVNLKIARARDLGPDINRIVGTSLDKGVEMDALIKLPEPERETLIAKAEAGEKVSARPSTEPTTDAVTALSILAAGLSEQPQKLDRKARQRQKFWQMWASLDDDVREDLHAKLRTM